MTTFTHGGDLFACAADTLDFSANTNLLGMPQGAREALAATVGQWEDYPDPLCRTLTAAIAGQEHVDLTWVQCGNGAADLLFRVVFALKPKRALTLAPTFSEYERALDAIGCETGFHTLHEKDGFAVTETLLKKLSPALDLLILCNPNNPTGQTIDPALLARIAKRCAEFKILLLVDECFNPFLDEPETHTLKASLAASPHVLLLKAFTKIYAMAGLRLGYLLCADTVLLDKIAACGQPWSVSTPAQIAGVAAISDEDYLTRTAAIIPQERVWLSDELQRLGLLVIGSQANYLFFKCNACRALKEKLLERGILIRSCADFDGLDDRFYRVALKNRAAGERLVKAIAAVLGTKED